MRRELAGGFELDDDPDRVDVDAVHEYLAGKSYWAAGPRDAHELYAKVGFGPLSERSMERNAGA
jgi:hypothetical protein